MFGRKKRQRTTDPQPVGPFRKFRWTRPFWGGLLVILGGLIIVWMPLGPIAVIIHAGVGGWSGFACGILMIAMGLFIWFMPSQRFVASVVAVIVSLVSFPLSNLGGFVVGMMAGVIGGCMAFGWVPDKGLKVRPPGKPPHPRLPVPGEEGPQMDIGSFTERV